MPKDKVHFTRIFYEGKNPIMPCDFCNYTSTSKTGMKLHRKVSHGITIQFDLNKEIQKICRGCKKEFKKCNCQK